MLSAEDLLAPAAAADEGPRRPFIEPGWYRDLSDQEYHSSFGLSSSHLKVLMEQTLAHFRHQMSEPDGDTKSTAIGGAVHAILLQPERYDDLVAELPGGLNLRLKADRETKDAFYKEHAGKSIITPEQKKTVDAMVASVRAHALASILLQDIIPESSVYWWYRSMDPDETGERFKQMAKVRPDALSVAHPVIIDLKTAVDASLTGFTRAVMRHYYHLSAAMYLEGVNQCRSLLEYTRHLAYTKFVFVVVENEPPHLTAVYELSPEFLEIGKHLYRRAMRTLKDAPDGEWPGFPDEIRVLEPPSWASRSHIV